MDIQVKEASAYSLSQVAIISGKTPAQVQRLIKKGFLLTTQTDGFPIVTADQLGTYYLFGQYGNRPSKKKKNRVEAYKNRKL